jgi:hypothetical protein
MPEERGRALVITSAEDAWAILDRIASHKFDPDDYARMVQFEGWECELMRIPHSAAASISMPVMRNLVGFQSRINHSYRDVKYGSGSSRRIRDHEKEEIELNIVVRPNGSVYDTDVTKPLTALAKAAASKMESKHLAITFIGVTLILAVGYFGSAGFKLYVESQKELHAARIHADEMIQLSAQETARAKILGSLVAETDEARNAQAQVEAGYQALLRGAAAAGGARVLENDVPRHIAEEITSGPRNVGAGARLDGTYEVVDIERLGTGIYSVQLRAPGIEKPITAEARAMFLPDDQIGLLFSSLKSGNLLPFLLNTWNRGGKIVDAEIIRVSPN